MKKKNIAVLVLILGIVLIVIGILFVYKEITDMNKEKKEIENNISDNHEKFRGKVDEFEKIRSTYYSDVVNDLYPETVKDNYKDWLIVLNNYTDIVDEVEKNSSYLKKHCINKFYSNKDIKNKCDAFVIAYETVFNYYTKDIISFNSVINEYYTQNEINKEESEIKEFELKYDYIDINTDGEFKGKD